MKTENIPYKIYLSESEMPQNWYNVRADMKNKPAPLVNPGTGKPMGFDDLRPVFCDELIEQELGQIASPAVRRSSREYLRVIQGGTASMPALQAEA